MTTRLKIIFSTTSRKISPSSSYVPFTQHQYSSVMNDSLMINGCVVSNQYALFK